MSELLNDAQFVELLEESVDDLYENAPSGYLSSLLDGTIVKVNKTFLDWTGYRKEELVGVRKIDDLLTTGGQIYFQTHYMPLLRMQGSVREIALDFHCGNGSQLSVLMNSVVKTNAEGTPQLIRTTVFDATERRSYERELLRAKERAERSEERARLLAFTLQQTLIPPSPPSIDGLDVGAAYRPAGAGDEVGGDFYDIFATGGGQWNFILGDVCGKGAEAAVVTALARYTARAAAMRVETPSQVLADVNEALILGGSERFCTAVYAAAEPAPNGWIFDIATAGHPLPICVMGEQARFVGGNGRVLGVLEEASVAQVRQLLTSGDTLVFYTDGVTEARIDDDFFGAERLLQMVETRKHLGAADMAAQMTETVVQFQNGIARDDIAIVVVKIP